MSEWYEAKDEDISVNQEDKEVEVWVMQGELGSVYVTLTFDQARKIFEKI